MEKDLSKNVLQKIKEGKIKPKPKWFFNLKESAILSAFILAIIFGGISFGLILSKMTEFDYDMRGQLPPPRFIGFLFLVFPYLWLIFFGIFLFGSYYYLTSTKHGYRYSFTQVAIVNIGISILFGIVLFLTGFSDLIQDNMRNRMPFYQKMFFSRDHMWMMAERGLLGGEIVEMVSSNEFTLKDFKGDKWNVTVLKEVIDSIPPLKVGLKIRMIGEKKENHNFEASDVKPWERGAGRRRRELEN